MQRILGLYAKHATIRKMFLWLVTTLRLDFLGRFYIASICYQIPLYLLIFKRKILRGLSIISSFRLSPVLNIHTLNRLSMNDDLPIPYMTGRFLLVESISKVEEYKQINAIEKFSLQHILDTVYPTIKKAMYQNNSLQTEFEKDVLEEYIHHMMIRDTSLLINFNICALSLRFNLVYLSERMVTLLGINHDKSLIELPNLVSPFELNNWVYDEESRACFREALTHLVWSYIFASAIAPTIEGLTMLITGESPDRYPKGVFQNDVRKVMEIARNTELLELAKTSRSDFVDSVIRIGQIISNIPLRIIERFKHNPKNLPDYLEERLRSLMDSIQEQGFQILEKPKEIPFEVADYAEKNPMRILEYILRKGGHYTKVRRLVYSLILRQPETIDIIRQLPATGFYKEPGIIISEPDGSLLPLDPEVKKTIDRNHIQGYEDFWGADRALIFYHKLILDALIHANDLEWLQTLKKIVLERWAEKSEKINFWLEILQKLWAREYGRKFWKLSDDEETINQMFRLHVKMYLEMLQRAKELKILGEVRRLSLLTYIHGHR